MAQGHPQAGPKAHLITPIENYNAMAQRIRKALISCHLSRIAALNSKLENFFRVPNLLSCKLYLFCNYIFPFSYLFNSVKPVSVIMLAWLKVVKKKKSRMLFWLLSSVHVTLLQQMVAFVFSPQTQFRDGQTLGTVFFCFVFFKPGSQEQVLLLTASAFEYSLLVL